MGDAVTSSLHPGAPPSGSSTRSPTPVGGKDSLRDGMSGKRPPGQLGSPSDGVEAGAKSPAVEWPRRMLTAGGWQSLTQCLSSQPESPEMHRVIAIGLKYLSQEVR